MVKVATSYSDKQVLLCTIDASVHTELKKYLLGGYPTVRVFAKGKVGDKSFLGNKPESFVRNFVDETIANSLENNNVQTSPQKRSNLIEIENTQQFENIISSSQVPVIVKFSAYWWSTCTNLKNTLTTVSASYSSDQVLICTVDAFVNSELKKYLLGGYPTVRVFSKGKAGDKSFVGSKSEFFVRNFIDEVIQK